MEGFVPFPADMAEHYRQAGYWQGNTLAGLLRPVAQADPGRLALVDERGAYTYGTLDAEADRIAAGLYELGVRAGDRVVVQLPNIAEFATVSVALFRLAAIAVYALPGHRRREIGYLCDHSEAVAYIVADRHLGYDYGGLADAIAEQARSVRLVVVAGRRDGAVTLRDLPESDHRPPGPSPDGIAFCLLSGGTTGLPKLIPRTHDDYSYQMRACAEGLGFGPDGVYLATLPVAHNAALGCPGLLGSLAVGGKTVLAATGNPTDVFDLVAEHRVTLTTLMPPVVALWLEAADLFDVDFSNLMIQVGSAHLPVTIARRVVTELGARLTHWFGMAEGLLTYTRPDDQLDVIVATQGRPLSGGDEIRVVAEQDQDVPQGAVGELLTRGPYTIRGYFKAPDANRSAFTADGFLRTGDLVRLRADGNMVVEGRIKDVINKGGEKIIAAELEDVLAAHPKVEAVAVVGVPDELMGERVCAFIETRASEPPTLAELREFLQNAGLADFKLPERLQIMPSLAKTTVGKVDKTALRNSLSPDRPASGTGAHVP
jgi:2,3-dihydroxybenzoate---[aryl-carrier protein] ligase